MPEPDPYLHFRQTRCPFIDILPDAAAPAAAQAARLAIQRPAPHAAAVLFEAVAKYLGALDTYLNTYLDTYVDEQVNR